MIDHHLQLLFSTTSQLMIGREGRVKVVWLFVSSFSGLHLNGMIWASVPTPRGQAPPGHSSHPPPRHTQLTGTRGWRAAGVGPGQPDINVT